jgi:hypothetical protein
MGALVIIYTDVNCLDSTLELERMIGKILGFILQILHGIFIFGLWFSPFYITNRYLLLWAIAIQSAILAHMHFFDKRCVVTMLEEWLTSEKIVYHEGKSMAGFNGILTRTVGVDTMLNINNLVPHGAIIANCYKLSYIV